METRLEAPEGESLLSDGTALAARKSRSRSNTSVTSEMRSMNTNERSLRNAS